MKKLFVVNVFSFETKMVTEILKRNGKEFVTIREDKVSDQTIEKINKAVKNKKEIIVVGCDIDKSEWQRCYGKAPMRNINYREDEKEKSLIKRIEAILKTDILTDFERVLASGMEDYIPGMQNMAEKLGMPEKTKQKTIKNVQRGRALFCEGIDRKALEDAEKAVNGRKEVGPLTVVEYDHKNNRPVMDLLWAKYEHLLVKNKKENKGVLFTPNYDLVEEVQVSGGETWTSKREDSTKYRVLSDHLAEMEEAVKRYFTR